MKNKQVKQMICAVDDGYKDKFWRNGELMCINYHLISPPAIRRVLFFGDVSLTSNQLKGK
ncbi:hypothetical protein [Vibrio casei]|uniref:hypothetical protein n=1 Tax=Vibrio casei TaxID=673372 RepID=UPI003F9ACED9